MAGSLTDIFAAMQNGVVALGNFKRQLIGSFNNISSQLTTNSADIAANAADIAVLQTPACFFAHKNGVDQTGIADGVFTDVTFGTETYDIGGHFAANTWTPPAGMVHLDACTLITGSFVSGAQIALTFNKNGVRLVQGNSLASSGLTAGGVSVAANSLANGTDAYTVQVFADVSSGTATILGNATLAYFTGFWVST